LDDHVFDGVAGDRLRLGHDRRHRLTDVADAVEREGQVRARRGRGGRTALAAAAEREGRTASFDVAAGEDGAHPGTPQRGRRVDASDPRVGVWAPDECDVMQARKRDVAHVGRGTSDEARVFLALDLRAHESGRRRHGGSSPPKFPTTRNEFFCGRIGDRVRCVSRLEDAMLGAWKKKVAMPSREETLPGRPQPMPIVDRHAVSGHTIAPPYPDGLALAMFGLGCFWGAEKIFWKTPGVWTTAVGYAGGYTPNPTYEEVCTGRTGHNEVVRVVFDPKAVGYETLLARFWEGHDPTQGMRQGNDVGTQYRSGIYVYSPEQRRLAEA